MRDLSNTHTIIGFISLNETPAVDINHLTPGAVIAAKHVKATNSLTECVTDFGSPGLLLVTQVGDKATSLERDR